MICQITRPYKNFLSFKFHNKEIHFYGVKLKAAESFETLYLSTKLHGFTLQKTNIFELFYMNRYPMIA